MSKLSREEFEKLMKEGRLDEVLEAVQVPLKSEPWKAKEMQLQEEMEGLVKLAKQKIADEVVRDEAKAFSAFAPLGDIFCPAGSELSEADRTYIEEFRAQAKAQLERIRGAPRLVVSDQKLQVKFDALRRIGGITHPESIFKAALSGSEECLETIKVFNAGVAAGRELARRELEELAEPLYARLNADENSPDYPYGEMLLESDLADILEDFITPEEETELGGEG